MYSGLQEKEPHEYSDSCIEKFRLDSQPPPCKQHEDASGRPENRRDIYLLAIENGDHKYTAYIVDNRECGDEYFQPDRHPAPEHGKDTERESDVGGHRYRRAAGIVGATRTEPVDEHGHTHASYGRDDGKNRVLYRGKLSHKNLALYLKTHREKEYRHQRVVDELHHRHRATVMAEEVEVSDAQFYLIQPKAVVKLRKWRNVHYYQSKQSGDNQYVAAICIVFQRLLRCKEYGCHVVCVLQDFMPSVV